MPRIKDFARPWVIRVFFRGFLMSLCLTPASAQTELVFDGMLLTHYLDRGELVVDAPVMQAEFDMAVNEWSFNVWGNIDLTDENDSRLDLSETALSLAYTMAVDPLDLSVGVTQYMFPGESGTRETFLHAAMLIPLNPAVGVYYDFDQINGTYIDGSIHHVVELSTAVSLESRVAIGYGDAAANHDAFRYDKAALRDIGVGATLLFNLNRHTVLSTGGSYWRLIDPDLRDTVESSDGAVNGMIGKIAIHRRFQ